MCTDRSDMFMDFSPFSWSVHIQSAILDLDGMARQLAHCIVEREYLEKRGQEDDGLIGLLQLCTAIMKHNPSYKFSPEIKVISFAL